MPLNQHRKIYRHPDVAWRLLENRLIAVTSHDTSIHRFNKTGTFIWNLLGTKGAEIGVIERSLAKTFNIPLDKAIKDTSSFIAKAIKGKILFANV